MPASPTTRDGGGLEGGFDIGTGGGDDGPTIDPPVQLFEMARVVEGAPWEILQDTGGIAVDPAERVFIADGIARILRWSWAVVETSPSYPELQQMTNEPFGFLFCGIAVSESSTLYFQTGRELWVGTPLR